jgi:hypothetical protein
MEDLLKVLTSCSYTGTWRHREADAAINDEADRLVKNGWKIASRGCFNWHSFVVATDGSRFETASAGACQRFDDDYDIIVARPGVRTWSQLFGEDWNDSPANYLVRELLPGWEDLAWAKAQVASKWKHKDVMDFLRITEEIREALGGVLPPKLKVVVENLRAWRKPAREKGRLWRRQKEAAWEAECAAARAEQRAAQAVDARLGDLSKWEEFVRPHRWIF